MLFILALLVTMFATTSHAATYYVSPSGSNSNTGTQASPWLTVNFAVNVARAWCGDTVVMLTGTYGNTHIQDVNCSAGDELTITAQSQRKAKNLGTPGSHVFNVTGSSYIIIDGLYGRGQDSQSNTGQGVVFRLGTLTDNPPNAHHITVRNIVATNPNHYSTAPAISFFRCDDCLLEDSEVYQYQRHCTTAWKSSRVVVRRLYCNPREGAGPGHASVVAGGALNRADAAFSMYPCQDCIGENIIMDGTTAGGYLNELNANGGGNLFATGSKILGSICYICKTGNGIFAASRTSTGTKYAPGEFTIRDTAFIGYNSISSAIRLADCHTWCIVDHVSMFGTGRISTSTGVGQTGLSTNDEISNGQPLGTPPSQNTVTITNLLVTGFGTGVRITGFDNWTGNEIISTANNTANFNPSSSSNWTNISTAAHGMGTCKLWVPVGAAGKGAGTSGSDIGATILNRYVNGVLTDIPLWDPVTGEFPHGEDDLDGVNNVAGNSLKDFHLRVNVNTNGCPFPDGYGGSGGGGGGGGSTPTNPSTHVTSQGTTSTTHNHTLTVSADAVGVCVALYKTGGNVGSVSSVTSGGESLTFVGRAVSGVNGWRAVEQWRRFAPTTGTRSIVVNTTGPVDGVVLTSFELENVDSVHGVATSGASSSNPTATASANAGEKVVDCLAAKKNITLTVGNHQTLLRDDAHSSEDFRLATSSQDGSNGGVMDYLLGIDSQNAIVAASYFLSPEVPDTFTRTLTDYRWECLLGAESGDCLNAVAGQPNAITPGGSARLRVKITGGGGSTAPAVGVKWYCRKDADAFTEVQDSFGSNTFRFVGTGINQNIPPSLSSTTPKLGTPFIPGLLVNDRNSVVLLPALPSGSNTEMIANIDFRDTLTPNAVMQCRLHLDNGGTLDDPNGTIPTITVVTPSVGID